MVQLDRTGPLVDCLSPGANSGTVTNVIRKSKAKGGQANNWVIDARASGLTLKEARRGVYRASGAWPAGTVEYISVIGDDFFFVGGPR
ncbi:MAG: hypothetical protein ACI9VR_002880 [Cognaticolwellia sp.]|jgi:hypothetical protein